MYIWNLNECDEIWRNAISKSIEDCLQDAILSEDLQIGDIVYIGECINAEIGGIDFSSVLDSVEQDMYEEVGEVSESWNISSISGSYADRKQIYDKYERELARLVKDYLKEIHEEPNFYKVKNVKPYIITQEIMDMINMFKKGDILEYIIDGTKFKILGTPYDNEYVYIAWNYDVKKADKIIRTNMKFKDMKLFRLIGHEDKA